MRHILTTLFFAMGLAACSSGGDNDAPKGKILKVGNGAEVQDLDPHVVTGLPEHHVNCALFEGLADIDPATLKPLPAAAESWAVSEDKKTYTFKIRTDAKWSNGAPLTAEDFVFSWQRMLSPALAAEYSYMLHCIKNAKAFNAGEIKDFAEVGVKALDAHTLEVTLESPTPYFLSMQMHQSFYPVHRATLEKFGPPEKRGSGWTHAGNHVGNGPFKLAEWRPSEFIRVVRSEQYWDKENVKLDGIEFYPIDNDQTEERSFRTGELNITETVPLHRIPVYQKENPELLHLDPYLGVYYYRFNVKKKPFDDVRVRKAFSMALDRDQLCKFVMKAGEKPAFTYVPPGMEYTPAAPLEYNPEKAKALLAEAGYPGGAGLPPVDILFNTSEAHKTIAEALQRMWKETLGADVRLMNQDWKVYLDTMNNLGYNMARSGWIADVADPINFLECYLSGGGNNRTGWSNAEYDAIIAAAYAETDEAKRQETMRKAEALLLDELPILPIYMYTRKYLKSPEVENMPPNLLGYMRWKQISLGK